MKIEKNKKLNKMRKQILKDDKKKRKKKDKNTVFKSKIPNIRPVPQNCIHLVKKGDLVYLVPGDGKCGPYLEMRFLGGNSEGK